jgi:hypothetical protein
MGWEFHSLAGKISASSALKALVINHQQRKDLVIINQELSPLPIP